MNHREQIRFWKGQFRVLKSWRLYFSTESTFKGQCHHNIERKTATIYGWSSHKNAGMMPKDYIFHEVIHIAQTAIRGHKKYRDKRKAEELFVQDLCRLMELSGNFDETSVRLKRARRNYA